MPSVWGLGLGHLVVQSALGEELRAEIDVSSLTADEASNLRIRVATADAYRAAGVDYNAVLPSTKVVLQRRSDGRPYLRISSDHVVQEPFVDLILELNWNTGRLVREYTLLIDPPVLQAQTQPAAPATPPVIAAAPAPVEPRAPAKIAEARPEATLAPTEKTTEARPAAPKAPPATAAVTEPRKASTPPAEASATEYRVKPGDTLSRIAGQRQARGVSLDQMLVALYRANPQAFVDSNMNRLKSGVVLTLPDGETAKAASNAEAHQIIQVQSADFAAYRQRLAGAVVPAAPAEPTRQASGKVQAAVDDRKQASAPAPDKLTLSKGGASAKASAPEERASKELESKDAAARAAELKRNVDELQKLAAATKPVAPASAVASAVPAAPAAAVAPLTAKVAAPSASVPVAAAPAAVVPAASAVAAASAPVTAPVVVAETKPAASAAPAPGGSAVEPALKAVVTPTRPATPPPSEPEGPGLIDTLLDDPLALGGGGLVVALLAGFGVYSYIRRSRRNSGETSFLESRLQPDSFFGASGGQHIDTREGATGAPSSMSYSLSQLDAIGDVDPVAEADVYLAYGRDLQAEEILKEAIRSAPSRLAVRTKLLEVYAKRRDVKGFELLALQLFNLTHGEGEDWAKAQELGLTIDPENALYQPGGRPSAAVGAEGLPVEPLGASTMPQSVLPSPSAFGRGALAGTAELAGQVPTTPPAPGVDINLDRNVDVDLDFDLNLDLDLDAPSTGSAAPPRMPETTQPMPTAAEPAPPESLEFTLPPEAPPEPFAPSTATPSRDLSHEVDLSGISLDLDAPQAPAPVPQAELAESDAVRMADLSEDDGDPFERKLELAEEFRQIGDMEGARDLLEEVIAQSGGALQAKARNMLDTLT